MDVVPPWADVPYPSRQRLYYEEGNRQAPFLYWPIHRPRILGPLDEMVNLFTDWVRAGAVAAASYYLDSLDDPETESSEVIIQGTLDLATAVTTASIYRIHNERIIFADGSELTEVDETTGAVEAGPTDLGGEIVSLCVDSSDQTNTITSVYSPPSECAEAFEDAYAFAVGDTDVELLGEEACVEGYDYETHLADEFDSWSSEYSTPPPEHSSCGTEWLNGLYVGFKENYDVGYTNEGCTPPS